MILSRYLAMRFLRMLLVVSAAFAGILFFVELVEQMRRFAGAGMGLAQGSILSLLLLPGRFYTILSLIVLLAAISLFIALGRTSELVAIRASGRSAVRFIAAPVAVAVLAGGLAVAVLNPIVAGTAKRYDSASARFSTDASQTLSLGDSAVWLRQSQAGGGQVVIRATRAGTDATTLYDAEFLIFAPDAGPQRRLSAREARLEGGAWQMTGVKDWVLSAPNPEASAQVHDTLALPSDLTAARIRDSVGAPEVVPIWQLPAFIRGLEKAGFSAQRHRVWFQSELARPALMAAMVILAAAFTLRHLRGRSTGVMVLSAFGAGLGLFFLAHLTQVLGDNGDIPPALAAWAAPATGGLLALARLLRLEDG